MKRAIIIENNNDLRKLLSINLELYVDVGCITKVDADDTIEFLKTQPEMDLIVCRNNVGDENTILKVFYYVKSNKLEIPIICLGPCPKLSTEKSVFIHEEERLDLKKILQKAAKFLQVTAEQMAEKEVDDYYPISIRNFKLISQTACNVYIQEGDSFNLFLKYGSNVDQKLINKLLLENVKELYVEKNDRLRFTNSLSDQALEVIRKQQADGADLVSATSAIFESTREAIALSGLDEESTKMAKTTISSMVRMAKSVTELSDLLAILEESGSGYLYRHSVLTATIAHHVVSEMEWGSKDQQETICFIAFFHDITLDDKLAKIHTNKELRDAKLTPVEEKKVMNHAWRASELISDYPRVPFGASDLILQHHCQLNGIGFPDNLSNQVSPLAVVFRVVEDYVELILSSARGEFKKAMAIKILRQTYNKGVYKKAVDALENMGK